MNIGKRFFSKATAWALLMAALVAAAVLWWVLAPQGAQQLYRTVPAKVGDVTQTVSANGTLNPVVLVSVGTQVSGTVMKLRVDYNDRVKAGQVLAELDPALLQAQVRQDEANVNSARAMLELAEANEARSRALYQQEFISRQDYDTAVQARKSGRAQLDQVSAQLAKDRTNLNNTVIRSPVSGVVVDRTVDVGQTVAASFQTPTLFRIAQDLRNMQIDSSFAEADIGSIKVGQPVVFTVDAFPDRTFSASVKQVRLNATVQQNVVTYDVVVAVSNPEEILMPGMTAYVNVVIAQRKSVLRVPNAALRFRPETAEAAPKRKPQEERGDGSRATVYVLAQSRLVAKSIRTGISDGRYTEVVSGELKDGDPVVVGMALGAAAEGAPSTLRMRMF
ncbi:MAG TPA: efflux RND transporter periplasmic adaptor subunit [Burkholderiales bacterium]|nr:efflux RND transporter periplasmic adaptor subunit [Burkholderiales bacterium]